VVGGYVTEGEKKKRCICQKGAGADKGGKGQDFKFHQEKRQIGGSRKEGDL